MIVTRKLLIPTLIFIAVMFVGFITINTFNTSADIEASEEQTLADKLEIFQERLESRESFAVGLALEVANNPEIQAAFAAGDRERLTELTLPSYLLIDEQFDVPQHQFHLPPATSFLRLHSLDKFDDDLSSFRFTVLKANAEQQPVSGLEIGRGGLGIRGVAPVSYENEHIGTVEFGLNVDQTLLNTLKEQMNADLQLMLLREPAEEVATFAGATADIQGPTDDLILQASTFEEPIFEETTIYPGVLEGVSAISRINVDDLQYAVISAPVYDFSGQVIGVVEIFTDRTAVVANQRQNVLTAVIAALATITLGGVGLAIIMTRMLRPIGTLTEAATAIAEGDLNRAVEVKTKDEFGTLATTFNNMTAQLRDLIDSLEQRVAQRTQVIETSSEVSRRLSTILDPSELTSAVVELLQYAFKYYHAHIYVYDEAREYLVMAGGTGEAGQAMLANNHKIKPGQGLVGRTAENNKPTLVPDVTANPNWLPNPLLPETKAEVAVPITLENEVLGVLDIQHNVVDGLDQADVVLLTSIANQVAIGLQNAKLFDQVELEKAQLQTILESLSTPVVISRVANGLVAYVNNALTEAFRLSREDLIGQATPDFYADPEERVRFLTTLREHGMAKDFEMLLKRGDGELFWGLASGRIINYEGEPAIVASIVDIHARKEAESLLAKQANELSTVAKVSTAAATILDPQELLQQVADLTRSSFDLYHAHIHLLDENAQTLVLTAGAGDVGRKMVAEGRRIPLAATGSLVASVARSVEGAIRNYESPEEGFMPHPLLTATRSEMAVPIAIGRQVFGVLDVRSDQLNHFDQADLQTVTTLASQIAVALQNARSYTRSEEALQELQELSRHLTREGWDEFFEQQFDELAFRFDLAQGNPAAASDEESESESETEPTLVQPLQVRGEPIGELLLGDAKLNEDEAAEIVAAVAERLSAHLENLRLTQQTQFALNETQRRTEELAVLNELSQSLTAQTTVDGVFQTVYDYLSRLMDTTNFFTVTYDEESDEVEFVLTVSDKELHWHTEKHQAGHGVTEYLIRQRQPLLMPSDVGHRLAELGLEYHDNGKLPASWLGVPIILGDRVLGVIGLESYTTPHLYNEEHLNLATAVANQAAIAIESARLLEGTAALAEEEQILRQITTRVGTAIDAESILRTAAEEIGRVLGLEGYVSLEAAGSNGTNGHKQVANSQD